MIYEIEKIVKQLEEIQQDTLELLSEYNGDAAYEVLAYATAMLESIESI